jgi:hypothetical protein
MIINYNGWFPNYKQTRHFIVTLKLRYQQSFSMYFLWEVLIGTLVISNNTELSLFTFCKSSIIYLLHTNITLNYWYAQMCCIPRKYICLGHITRHQMRFLTHHLSCQCDHLLSYLENNGTFDYFYCAYLENTFF